MYFDFFVEIPDVKGKITTKKKGSSIYVNYEIGRDYDPDKKYNVPRRVTIGKVSGTDRKMMVPNQNFLTYFPEVDLPELKYNPDRSSCLKIGAHLVIRKMFDEYNLPELLGKYFDERELGLFLELAAYSLVCENNAGQYYPMYAYSHPLFTESMYIYSDSKVSDLRNDIMARMTMESIDEKIKKAEDRVAKTGRIYNEACDELQKLREKKAAIENEALVAAFMKSSKSLEEAIAFFESETVEKDEELKPKRRGGRRKKSK